MNARNPEGEDARVLIGRDRAELRDVLAALDLPARELAMRARQLFGGIYARGARDFEEMSDLPKGLRATLAAHFTLERPEVLAEQRSRDGTIKWLLGLHDGRKVETVFIPEADRGTLCISSQVGCALSCAFCRTGTMPLVRNLGAGEILAQILLAKDRLGDWPADRVDRRLTNLVLMGMGEPLFNYDQVRRALAIVLDAEGLGLSRRRVTVSTAGVVPGIDALGRDLGVRLAVSLHAPDDALRSELVPLNRKWNIEAVLAACRRYPARRHITFEYVMLDGVNDTPAHARALAARLRNLPAKVNLIPFNPWPGSPYRCSSPKRMRAFRQLLERAGIEAPIRTPRGRDIMGACGQLATDSQRRPRRAA